MKNAAIFLIVLTVALGASESGLIIIKNGQSRLASTVQEIDRTEISVDLSSLKFDESEINEATAGQISLPEGFDSGAGEFLNSEKFILPTISCLIAVPFDSDPEVSLKYSSQIEIDNFHLIASEADQIRPSGGNDEFARRLESKVVAGNDAGIMRDLRLYSVTIAPVQYDSNRKTLKVYDRIVIEVAHAGSQMTSRENRISEAFRPIYRSFVENPAVFDPIEVTRGAYWVIYPDVYQTDILQLANWKKAKGFAVEMIPLSAIGTNPNYTLMKQYITSRWDSCSIKPDYIVITSDVVAPVDRSIPTREYTNPFGFGDIESDNYFSFISGGDYFPELLIGRISVDNLTEFNNYMYKLTNYERTPYTGDMNWYRRGVMVAGNDSYSFISPRWTKLWCREAMLQAGYTQVDTFFATDYIPPSAINNVINAGVSYVNYRGYGTPSGWTPPDYTYNNINQLSNGPKFPIMTSMVCGTGDFNDDYDDVCFGEAWIRYANKGGAGFIGNSNHDAHTRFTNTLDIGTYWGLFSEHVTTLGQAQLMGKMKLYEAFPQDIYPNGQVELYFNSYNILGDPEINCWTGEPNTMISNHPDSIPYGENLLNLHIENDQGGAISRAYVCIWKGNEIFKGDFSDENGDCSFSLNPESAGIAKITYTCRGYFPIEDSILIYNTALAVGYSNHIIDDDDNGQSYGDGDYMVNPSEIIEIPLQLKNFGQLYTASGVTATITSTSPYVGILQGILTFSEIMPGDTIWSDQELLIQIHANAPNSEIIGLQITVQDNQANQWLNILELQVKAAFFSSTGIQIIDGDNNRVDPGDAFELTTTFFNSGDKGLSNAQGILRCYDSNVLILDSVAYFGSCQPGQGFENSVEHFQIQVSDVIFVGHLINFEIEFMGQGPVLVNSSFNITVGVISSTDPIGPDNYGYYCFDNTDTSYVDHPAYNWVNIDVGNWSYVELQDDDVQTISMPFTVKYYGQEFNTLTICDNGFIAMGDTWWPNFYNGPIPAPQNAPGMMAPFWDDIIQSNLRVYYHYDIENDRFIIGWQNVYDDDNTRTQTFEIIILNEPSHPTRTHDNEIIFQYNLVQGVMTSSVGICSPDRRDGIGYMFNGTYTAGAAALNNTRAIKFTTRSIAGGCDYVLGDINGNGAANGLDIVYGVNYLKGGIPPPVSCDCPPHGMLYAAGDVNGSCSLNGLDITYFVNYLKGGELLRSCDDCPPSWLRPTSQH